MFYLSNKTRRRIHYKEFYNDTVNTDYDYKKVLSLLPIKIAPNPQMVQEQA